MEDRSEFIGASDAPVIMGVSKWKTKKQLWEEMIGLKGAPAMNHAMRFGLENEHLALQEFEEMTGLALLPQKQFTHPDYPFLKARPDAVDVFGKFAVELKCAGQEDHNTALQDKVPAHYYPQLQHQAMVLGVNKIFYFSYHKGSGKVIEVDKNDIYIEKMLTQELDFWQCVLDFKEPPDCEDKYQQKGDDIWLKLASDYEYLESQIKRNLRKKEEVKQSLIHLSKGQNCQGGGIKLSKVISKGTVDYDLIPELKDLNLDSYRKPPIESWRVTKE